LASILVQPLVQRAPRSAGAEQLLGKSTDGYTGLKSRHVPQIRNATHGALLVAPISKARVSAMVCEEGGVHYIWL
jgi:hypothetical protein